MANFDFRENTRQLQQKINYRVIGSHMKDIREACDMTQSCIAEKMGIGSKYYASLEIGYSKISFARFIQFLCITNASADAILIGCHAELQAKKLQDVQDEQTWGDFEKLLSQSSKDMRGVMFAVCDTLLKTMK